MMKKMTKKEGRAFKRRWAFVNQFEIQELRKTPVRIKLQQLASLMFSVNFFGWRKTLAQGESEVRERWHRLRKACHV